MKKIFFIFGTRPEAIKLAPLIRKFIKEDKIFSCKVCVTGQHREMLDQVLNLFDILPDFDLNLMKKNQSLAELSSNLILQLTPILQSEKPDIVFVHGDTTTSFCTSLASFYEKIPVAHVEAGLRTSDIYNPWPEEINRRLVATMAKYHFAPTTKDKNNLIRENIPSDKILVTGNTVVDALLEVIDKIENDDQTISKLENQFKFINSTKKLILVTCHRRESYGEGFKSICLAIKSIATKRQDVCFVYPVHLNPNVKNIVHEYLGELNNVILLKPLDYLPFVYLMKKSFLILTDSGGVQEEAPTLNKYALVMREKTERYEAIVEGNIKMVGTNQDKIYNEVINFLDKNQIEKNMSNPFGDGNACERIVSFIKRQNL